MQGRFRAVYEKINLVLDGMPYSEIGISDEVKEQVRFLMHPACSIKCLQEIELWIG